MTHVDKKMGSQKQKRLRDFWEKHFAFALLPISTKMCISFRLGFWANKWKSPTTVQKLERQDQGSKF